MKFIKLTLFYDFMLNKIGRDKKEAVYFAIHNESAIFVPCRGEIRRIEANFDNEEIW